MAVTQEPILSRLDRLDNLMRHLEELKANRGVANRGRSSSPTPSTPSSGTGTTTSEGHASFLDFSPRSRDQSKHPCRSIDDVIVETEYKGTLLDRVARMEDSLFTVCLQLEEEMIAEKQDSRRVDNSTHEHEHEHEHSPKKKKGLKQFVKSCVKGKDKDSHGNKLHY